MTQSPSPDLEYWRSRLQDQESCLFPTLIEGAQSSAQSKWVDISVPELPSISSFCQDGELHLSTIFQTAWGLVLRSYTGVDNVSFGFKAGATQILPCNLALVRETSIKHALDTIDTSFARDLCHADCSLEDLEAALHLEEPGLFNTALNYYHGGSFNVSGVEKTTKTTTNGVGLHDRRREDEIPSTRYIIEIDIRVSSNSISGRLNYQTAALSPGSAANVGSALEMALGCVLQHSDLPIGEQNLFSSHHQQQVDQWNRTRPASINMTLHAAISERCNKQLDAQAVNAWDAKWTFREVDELSSTLALHLVNIGVKVGMKIPLVFERSGWWVIALLAVSKAGAAFVPVEPKQPLFRLREIMEDIEPKFLLASNLYAELLADVVETTVVVSPSSLEAIKSIPYSAVSLPDVSPDAHAYVMFTSGSTGRPKGAVLQHGGYLAALLCWLSNTSIGPGTMALQASSYAWSVCIIETICSLWMGACLCIPSDHTKVNEFAGVFDQMQITWAILSPSIIKSASPELASSLTSLILCGEPVSKEVVSRWASSRRKVWVAWAATECLAICRPDNFTAGSNVQNLGPCKGLCRVVDVNNPERQVPIGAVGEIVIHGPWIAEGYLRDAERSALTFLHRPQWLDGTPSPYGSKWYRVGDLVRQNADGSLMLAGRGDSMVKIRGQRFDMSEIERNLAADDRIRNSLPVLPKSGVCKHRLVAVVSLCQSCPADKGVESDFVVLKGEELLTAALWVSNFREVLAKRLPSYAIPTIWVMVKSIPLTITGKIDRVSVKRFVEKMDVATYENVSALGVRREPPTTPMEKCLQKIWSSVLGLPCDKIGRNQSFISLGGDSIMAMMVGAKCRNEGLTLRVEDILNLGSIAEIALQTRPVAPSTETEVVASERFAVLRQSIKDQLHQVGVADASNIEDAYPCSPMQQGMLLSKARLTGDYNTSTIYEIIPLISGSNIDIRRLKAAWQQVVDRHASLRTFFVESMSQIGSFDQVVLKAYNTTSTIMVLDTISVQSKEEAVKAFSQYLPTAYGGHCPPHNLTILPTKSGEILCRLNIEHTLVDGMSLSVIVRDLNLAYHCQLGLLEPPTLYSSYVAKLQQVVCSIDNTYWKGYLKGINPCILPNLTYSLSRGSPKAESRSLAVDIKNPHHLLKFCQSQDLTLSALLRAIWGVILRKYTGSDDVCFGFITSGRDIPLDGVEEIVGTLINMLICRMNLDDSMSFRGIVNAARADYLSSLPHQHASLAQIQHVLGLYGQPLFNTSMTVLKEVPQNHPSNPSFLMNNIHEFSPNEYDLDVQVWVSSSNVRMELWYRTETISVEHAMNIASTFSKALEIVTDDPDQRLGQLDLFSDYHRNQVWKWNAVMPATIDMCLHDLISKQSKRRPNAVAVLSWDRELTWRQLETYSDMLGHHLVSLGVGPELHVIMCFEKSALAIVAMLAALKAGGVVVSVDPSHPIQRLRQIFRDTKPVCCLASPLHSELLKRDGLRGPPVVEVRESLIIELSSYHSTINKPCPGVRPHNAAFVLFTSGSTGTPKGIVHEHRTIASSLEHHGKEMGIGIDARTMQFSAFVFDVSITEIFMSLTRGGVLCIPSEDERMNNLESAFGRMRANWAHLTPTVASLLDPDSVPSLKHLALAGEPLKKINVTDWAPKLELINLYGPAECALATTLRVGCDRDDRPDNIGRAVGLLVWIIDPSNSDHLVPVGAVGEILLEGPNVAREYLKDKERTIASFIENPAWLDTERTMPPRRFYRSGDLARYNGDGSIQILGRIDTQVKLHGQRVELGEIEYQVKVNLSPHGLVNLAVVYTKSFEHPGGGFLSAFLEFGAHTAPTELGENGLIQTFTMRLRMVLVKLKSHLSDTLPSYMVPAMFVPLHAMPLLAAGKIDRGKLTRIAMNFSADEIRLYSLSEFREEKGNPGTKMERLLHKLWAEVLNIDRSSIGTNDNFFRIGGDSVVAMRLAAVGRRAGITITVANIFQNPKLSDMANIAMPFSENTIREIENQYSIRREIVQDIVPCSPLQEGLMATSNRLPGTYTAQHIFCLASTLIVDTFTAAWEIVYTSCPILRTRIVNIEGAIGTVQVIVDDSISWRKVSNLEEYLEADKQLPMVYGEPLTRYSLVNEGQLETRYFVWTAHHAVFDNQTLGLLLSEVRKVYEALLSSPYTNSSFQKMNHYRAFSDHLFKSDISGAECFWTGQLSDAMVSSFPRLPTGHQPLADSSLTHLIPLVGVPTVHPGRLSTVVQAAWALLLAQYSESPASVTFGMTLDGRHPASSIPNVSAIIGPTIATVPLTIFIDYGLTIGDFLSHVKEETEAVQKFQHFGLQNMKALGNIASKACDFQSLLSVWTESSERSDDTHFFTHHHTQQSPSTLLMLFDCMLGVDEIGVTVQYDPKVTLPSQMKRILQQLEQFVRQLIELDGTPKHLVDLDLCGPEDAKYIQSWNNCLPPFIDKCVHHVITNYSLSNPEAMAVCSWDGSLTYSELDKLSTTLGNHLSSTFGVGPEVLVPLAFTQSTWAIVAMLAVLKAGGGYVPMDPSYPPARLQKIVDSVTGSVILCSKQFEVLSRSLKRPALVVDREIIASLPQDKDVTLSKVHSSNVAYVIFTSGSTGEPKGVVMEHGSFCTAATAHGKRLNLNSESRVIHFSSYAFEACILEILTTLFNGGCVCVAPESQRLGDITRAMREFRVNWAFFTPSFVRTIHPDQVPDLKTLVLGGEALGADNIDIWVDRVYLVNGYGPSETCVFSVINENVKRGVAPDLIGSPIGCACWIVDQDDHRKLVPVGCIGELLIEGPTLARGYLNDSNKTEGAFLETSLALDHKSKASGVFHSVDGSSQANGQISYNHNSHGEVGPPRRVYRTGDLVLYNTNPAADGTIRIVGRKDSQVKIRGQRTEMGDIEHHLKSHLAGIKHVAVEYASVGGRENRQLVAFFPVASEAQLLTVAGGTSSLVPMSSDLKRAIMVTKTTLLKTIPSYMIPALYITLSSMPLLPSGKTDRQKLRAISSSLSSRDISHYSLSADQKRDPKSDKEVQMASLWKRVLDLSDDMSVGLDDNFFGLGGDSINAMRLTTLAREYKSVISVAHIFQNPRLEDMTMAALDLDASAHDTVVPFSLIKEPQENEGKLTTLHMLREKYDGDIEDAFPCGPLQEGLMLLSIKHPGSYMSQITLRLRPQIDIGRLKAAWQAVADRHSILRTRITYVRSQCVQYITKEKISWQSGTNLDGFLEEDKKSLMGHGSALVRYTIIEDETSSGERYFVLTAHHSLYDGWSLMLIMEDLDYLYSNGNLERPAAPYAGFIKHLNTIDSVAAESFWRSMFANKSLRTYPEPRLVTPAQVETQLSQFMPITRPVGSEITLSTVIRAAWALVTARYAETDDVFFGATLMGRNAPLPNIERLTGPTITTVPICVSIDIDQTVGEYLRGIQDAATEMMPFEHTGLQNIKRMGPEAEMACSFQNLLVIQPEDSEHMSSVVWEDQALFAKGEMVVLTYALIIECRLYKNQIRITAQYRDHVIPTRQMQRILDQFEGVLRQLNEANQAVALGRIDICTLKDKEEIRTWNGSNGNVSRAEHCIHDSIRCQAVQQPLAPAIESWDVNFNYKDLDSLSTKLARHLSALGARAGWIIPLCFDKSAWTVVAILAVLKVGAAYVSLDPKHPQNRKDHIVRDVSAKIILTASQYQAIFGSAYHIVVIDGELSGRLSELPQADYAPGNPSNAAFVVFTSGSTGTPKGIVMEHGAFCTSAREHCKALHINNDSRVMQFAAYTYDVSMAEILSTLIQGGCICIPSEEDRLSRLAISINTLKADWIFLTPTVAALLNPQEVPGLKTLVLGGEHATAGNFKNWASHLCLINSYGPAECAIWCACYPNVSPTSNSSNIGRPVGASLWIVEASDPNKLAPIGCVGELVVEGPTLAREYLNDPAKTKSAFIEDPEWSRGQDIQLRRMYRTGDLVRYSPTGDLIIVGRRDTQVKFHGQRIELGEIEHHIIDCSPPTWVPVVHLLDLSRSGRGPTLVTFIHDCNDASAGLGSGVARLPVTEDVKASIDQLWSKLEQSLPSHMIPTVYIPVTQMPLTAGGKVDRGILRDIGQNLTVEELHPYLLANRMPLRPPSTMIEKKLQSLWVRVLNIDGDSIGIDSNFLRLGGDSVAAMRLSAAAREDLISLAVRDIFSCPKLEDMSKCAKPISSEDSVAPAMPFSTLKTDSLPALLQDVVYPQLHSSRSEIQDILEATGYQRWVIGCGQLKTRGYNNYFTLRFKGTLDLSRLQNACHLLLERHPILRTVFLAYKRQLFQIVLKHIVPQFIYKQCQDEPAARQSVLDADMDLPVVLGQTSIRFTLLGYGPCDHELLMRVSHAQYDGISLPILMQDLKAAYLEKDFSDSFPYSAFIYGVPMIMEPSQAEEYWRNQLHAAVMTAVIEHTKPTYAHALDTSLKCVVPTPLTLPHDITPATAVKTAWSFTLAQFSDLLDITFGQITTGRNAAIRGIDKVVGPCMNLVPVRVKIDADSSISDVARQIQTQHLEMSAYEHLGLQDIIENCTDWPKWTRMSSILQHTNFNVGMNDTDMWDDMEMKLGNFTPDHDVSDIWIWTGPATDGLSVDFTYSSSTIPAGTAQKIFDGFCMNLSHVLETPDMSVSLLLSSNSTKLLPLPLPRTNGSSVTFSGMESGPGASKLAEVVEETWSKILGDEHDQLPDGISPDTPFYDIRGDLLAASQLAAAYGRCGFTVAEEEVIDNASRPLQAVLLASK